MHQTNEKCERRKRTGKPISDKLKSNMPITSIDRASLLLLMLLFMLCADERSIGAAQCVDTSGAASSKQNARKSTILCVVRHTPTRACVGQIAEFPLLQRSFSIGIPPHNCFCFRQRETARLLGKQSDKCAALGDDEQRLRSI